MSLKDCSFRFVQEYAIVIILKKKILGDFCVLNIKRRDSVILEIIFVIMTILVSEVCLNFMCAYPGYYY